MKVTGWVVVGLIGLLGACGGSSTNNDSGAQNNDSGQNNDAGAGSGICTTGTLFAGDPVYVGQPSDRATSGTGIVADPPLLWQSLVFSGTHLYTRQESEIWSVDLSATSPVETLIASMTPTGSTYPFNANAVKCSVATYTQLRGLAALSDGSLVAADLFAGAIIKITNPDSATTCMSNVLAGYSGMSTIDPSDTTTYPPQGNMDGTGSVATFNSVHALAVDSADNIYVVDNSAGDGMGKTILRKVDKTGVVTTVLTMPSNDPPTGPESIENMVFVGTTLYAASRNSINQGYVIKIDPVAKTFTNVAGGGGSAWDGVDSAADPETSGIASDGTNFYVAGAGYVWLVTPAGKITLVAGTGVNPDYFASGYDPKASHPALQLALPTAIGSADENGSSAVAQLAYHSGALYYRGFADGTSGFIEKIGCP